MSGRGRGRGRGATVKAEHPPAPFPIPAAPLAQAQNPPDAFQAQSPAPAEAPPATSAVKKFQPKIAPRKVRKPVEVKSEPGEVDAAQIEKLIQDAQAAAQRRGFKGGDNKGTGTRVAFGSGSGASLARVGFAKSKSSSSGTGGGGGWRGPDKKPGTKSETGTDEPVAEQNLKKPQINVFDTMDDNSYKPISLPLQRPPGVGTEFSDDETDEEDEENETMEENKVPAVKELGLETENSEERLLFLQIPSILPSSDVSGASLNAFSQGMIGRLQILESGAIKLVLGNNVMNVVPGTRCNFSQEVVAINSSSKKCAFLGDVGQRLVVSPDIDGLTGGSS